MYTSRDVAAFMKPLFNRYEALAPNAFILVRGDSGIATPELYELVEAKKKHYIVVVKMEKPAGELLFNFTCIVTTLDLSPEDIIRIYCNRGKMEIFIKEAKNGFACQKMSSTHFQANEVKLQISLLAYNFNNWFR